jgi:uncharacterized protein with HEPN domain
MREPDPLGELTQILEAISRIHDYVEGLDEASFCSSAKDVDSVATNLIVIGEAVRCLKPEILALEPSIRWSSIIAVRNRIAHGYSMMQRPLVWAIVSKDLPNLQAATLRLIAHIRLGRQ